MNIQEFIKLAQERSSIRKYSNKEVSCEVINQIIESARIAPSAVNFQPWKFLIIKGEKSKQIVRESYKREWFVTAPLYIIACGNHQEAWHRSFDGKDHTDIDIAIAVEHICLSATSAGLGTCWVCNFDATKLKTDLSLPEDLEPIAIIPLGYPEGDGDVRPKKRKTTEEIVQWLED
ncbi:MAG: nitroreductase family protein [Bacteroidales bacterium]|nr:nitroreductase family protein [Bacteroidales bacterium]